MQSKALKKHSIFHYLKQLCEIRRLERSPFARRLVIGGRNYYRANKVSRDKIKANQMDLNKRNCRQNSKSHCIIY